MQISLGQHGTLQKEHTQQAVAKATWQELFSGLNGLTEHRSPAEADVKFISST